MIHVRYDSVYGSTKQYAERLAALLGTEAYTFDHAIPEDGSPVIALSPVHGPVISAVKLINALQGTGRALAVVGVGMTLLDDARKKDQMKSLVDDTVARFYLPGRMNYSELTAKHSAIMASIIKMIKLKPKKTANDKAMIEAYGKDVDRVDFTELERIIDWARAAMM